MNHTFFKKALFVALLVITDNLCAGGFNADITDWSKTVGQTSLGYYDKDYVPKSAERLVTKWARQVGVTGPVKLKPSEKEAAFEGGFEDEEKNISNSSSDEDESLKDDYANYFKKNLIHLKKERLKVLTTPCFLQPLSSSFYETKGIIHHELGHALLNEQTINKDLKVAEQYHNTTVQDAVFLWCFLKNKVRNSFYKNQLHEEIFADETVPQEKKVLKATRDLFAREHLTKIHDKNDRSFLDLEKENLSSDEKKLLLPCLSTLSAILSLFNGSFTYLTAHDITNLKSSPIDFSQPMHEDQAKAWDHFHRWDGDEHPSHYRRAYNFHNRYIALEQKDCAALEEHVGSLTSSDLC